MQSMIKCYLSRYYKNFHMLDLKYKIFKETKMNIDKNG